MIKLLLSIVNIGTENAVFAQFTVTPTHCGICLMAVRHSIL